MATRIVAPNLFAPSPPNWSLQLLDANAQNAASAINDSSLGATNGPLADTGSANNYLVTCSYGTPSAYNNGMTVFFTPANTNTGASTLTVSPLSSAPIVSTSSTALVGGELAAGTTIGVVYDGTQFRIFNLPSPASIWSARLRSFNAIGNPNFEVDQRNVGNLVANVGNGVIVIDRWQVQTIGTMRASVGQSANVLTAGGTNFAITSKSLSTTVTTTEASLAAGDFFQIMQFVEGPYWRELSNDVTSISLLVYCSVANFKFSVALRDAAQVNSLVKLCTLGAVGWTLITLPNIPKPGAGTWSTTPGVNGYILSITLACGTTYTAPAADTWQSSNYIAAPGTGNLFATAGASFYVAMIQHESGSQCTTFMDLDFDTNLSKCERYYIKSYDYATKPGAVTSNGAARGIALANLSPQTPITFRHHMAKVPTVTGYSTTSGTAATVRDATAGADKAITGTIEPGESGFSGFTITSANAANYIWEVNYTSDTGW